MEKSYVIRKTAETELSMHASVWDTAETLEIDVYPWDESGYTPRTSVKLLYNDEGITALYESDETEVLARYHGLNEPVCTDSCVELFLNPNPQKSADYLNFEVSAGGGIMVGKGDGRHERHNFDTVRVEDFRIEKEIRADGWTMCFFIPFAFLKEQYGDVKTEMRGNLQKCGDDTVHPHFGCWNPIAAPHPDFHRPECFGTLILEEK